MLSFFSFGGGEGSAGASKEDEEIAGKEVTKSDCGRKVLEVSEGAMKNEDEENSDCTKGEKETEVAVNGEKGNGCGLCCVCFLVLGSLHGARGSLAGCECCFCSVAYIVSSSTTFRCEKHLPWKSLFAVRFGSSW